MSHVVVNAETGEPRSRIACQVCRRRKIKCSRELPHCCICKSTAQECAYPEIVGRPGPRIGTSHKRRKRNHEDDDKTHRDLPGQRRLAHRRVFFEDVDNCQERINSMSPQDEPTMSTNSETRAKKMQDLWLILHESYESCPPENYSEEIDPGGIPSNEEPFMTAACFTLCVGPAFLNALIDTFFNTFTSFRLFREASFRAKLYRIASSAQTIALLSAISAFGTNALISEAATIQMPSPNQDSAYTLGEASTIHFVDLAMENIDRAVSDCGDEVPPLCLLQALILTTHWLLIQGVRGRAWRYLGTCIRIAYEMNLHLVDSGKPSEVSINTSQWCEDEERRRAWWAIWEMDVFASVIRHVPCAIDWSQNETFLPAEDERWFRGEPQSSCILDVGWVDRCKTLQASGNQSPKAWFLVLTSLNRDAQKIVSPIPINIAMDIKSMNNSKSLREGFQQLSEVKYAQEAAKKLSTLQNALLCFNIALPSALRYRNQYLSFELGQKGAVGASSKRHLHSAIYSISLLADFTKMIIHTHYIFGSDNNILQYTADLINKDPKSDKPGFRSTPLSAFRSTTSGNPALDRYFQAADNVIAIIHGSTENHYRYVNPFLSNAIWLGVAVQLVRREVASSGTERDLVNSNLEVLCMTYDQFIEHWKISPTQKLNLDALSGYVKGLRMAPGDEGNSQILGVTARIP